jgi:hypothetical protein
MKTTTPRKLQLARQALRTLTTTELRTADGGRPNPTVSVCHSACTSKPDPIGH